MSTGQWVILAIFVAPWTLGPLIYFIGASLFGWGKDDPELTGEANRWKLGD